MPIIRLHSSEINKRVGHKLSEREFSNLCTEIGAKLTNKSADAGGYPNKVYSVEIPESRPELKDLDHFTDLLRKKMGRSSSSFTTLFVILPCIVLFIAFALVYLPNFCWHILIVIDWVTPFQSFNSPWVARYHEFLMSRLPVIPERPAIEIPWEEATLDKIYELSQGYIIPVVVRGGIANATAIGTWNNKQWWVDNYPNDKVMCKFVGGVDNPECTVKEALGEDGSEKTYISGEGRLFTNHPELEEMVNSPALEALIDGQKRFTQIFMGYPGMGSNIHSAVGCNIFRMIAGRKKWWLIPVHQTPFTYASLNANGFSSHTKTMVGLQDDEPSPWLEKIERYTAVLEPGDVLINTAWYWHGILNLGDDPDELVIGVPTRYTTGLVSNMRADPLYTSMAIYQMARDGGIGKSMTDMDTFQKGIEKARTVRGQETMTVESANLS